MKRSKNRMGGFHLSLSAHEIFLTKTVSPFAGDKQASPHLLEGFGDPVCDRQFKMASVPPGTGKTDRKGMRTCGKVRHSSDGRHESYPRTKFPRSDSAISPAKSTILTSNLEKKGPNRVIRPWGCLGSSFFAAYIRARNPSQLEKMTVITSLYSDALKYAEMSKLA